VLDVDAGVDDIRAGAGTGARVVHVQALVAGAVRDASKTPRDVGALGDDLVDGVDGVLLNVLNLRALSAEARFISQRITHLGQVLDGLEGRAAQVGRETLELAVAVDVVGADTLDGVQEGRVGGTILELDDVAAGDELSSAGLNHRRREGQGKQRCQGEVVHRVDKVGKEGGQ
jgi:hypothetical protein